MSEKWLKHPVSRVVTGFAAGVSLNLMAQICAVPGLSGPGTVSGIVNTYYSPPIGSLAAGATSLSLGSIDPAGATTAAQVGDLLLIVQMQGATINAVNNNCYGDGAGPCTTTLTRTGDPARGYNGTPTAGLHEYVRVASNSAGVVTFTGAGGGGGLVNNYTQAAASATQGQQTYQIIRVPQYSSATINSATPLTSSAWNGASGGIVAIDVAGSLATNGGAAAHINVSNRGFRGGFGQRGNGPFGITDYMAPAQAYGADRDTTKGEGIAGTPKYVFTGTAGLITLAGTAQGYPGGDFGRGAPGNAGGGGVGHNTGGGGGGNGGSGGLGGAEYNTQTDYGAYGGAAFPQTGAVNGNQIVMGGGGGAGDTNGGGTDPVPDIESAGGVGGGLIFVSAGNVTTPLNLVSNGLAGQGSSCETGGGGGAGGSIKVIAGVGLANVFATAIGGAGGSNDCTVHSGGGGGAGGVVVSNGTIGGATLTAGAGGISPSAGLWNGVAGNVGATATTATVDTPGADAGYSCLPALTTTKTTSTTTISTPGGTTATYTIAVNNSAVGAAIGVDLVDNALPPGWTFSTSTSLTFTPPLSATQFGGYVEGATAGTPAVANSPGGIANLSVNGVPGAAPLWSNLTIPGGGTVTLVYSVNIPASEPVGTYHNPAGVRYLDPTRSTVGREITPAVNNTANLAGTQVGGTANATYEAGQNVGGAAPGANYSGLVGGSTGENVTLLADVSVSKTVSTTTPTLGAGFTYTLTPRNNGRAIQNVTFAADQTTDATAASLGPVLTGLISDTLPTGVVLTATPTGTNWTCTGAVGASSFNCAYTGTYPWAAATDLPTITVPVRTLPTACGAVRVNTATIGQAQIGESDTANNVGTAPGLTPGCTVGLSVSKTDSKTTAVQNATNVYTITVANAGPAPADGTVVTDPVAAGLTCSSVTCGSTSGGAVCPVAPTIAGLQGAGLTIPTLPSGGSVVFTVTCSVTATGV